MCCSQKLWQFFLSSTHFLTVTEGPMAPFHPSPFLLDSEKAGQHHPHCSHALLQPEKLLVGTLREGGRAKPPGIKPSHPLTESAEHLSRFRYHHPKVTFSKHLRLNFCELILGTDPSDSTVLEPPQLGGLVPAQELTRSTV